MTITVGGFVGVGGFAGGWGSGCGPGFTRSGAVGPGASVVSSVASVPVSVDGSAGAVSATGAPSRGSVVGGASVGPVLTRGF